MRDTRQDILDTAKRLFNEQGYNNVTTRDISETLGISKGNLTYYFKKKEDIIEAIITESPNTRISEAPESLAELNAYFMDIQKMVQENAFYFWHHAQFAQISPKIQDLQKVIFDDNTKILTKSLSILKEGGWIRGEIYPGEYNCIIDTLLILSIYWVPFSRLKDEDIVDKFLQQMWSSLYPLLTNSGIEIVKGLI